MGKNLLKKTNNAIIHSLFRHSAINRRFFPEISTNISFFAFSFNFGVLVIVTIYIQTTKVRL